MKKFELSIPKPCHENWNGMTPEEKGRFCGVCQKTVIDFRNMSDRQLADFFKKPEENLCGRFAVDQLERVIEKPRKRLPWIKYFFTIALPAFLLSKKAAAQGHVVIKEKAATCEKQGPAKDTTGVGDKKPLDNSHREILGKVWVGPKANAAEKLITLRGNVKNENGEPVQYATVQITGINVGTITDSLGNFTLTTTEKAGAIQVSYVGYALQEIRFQGNSVLSVTLQLSEAVRMGEIVITAVKPKKPVPAKPVVKTDVALFQFTVYPNPVDRNATVSIQPKKLQPGNYSVEILSSTGELVQTTEVVVGKQPSPISVQLSVMNASPYFIRLTNKASKKSSTEILLVR